MKKILLSIFTIFLFIGCAYQPIGQHFSIVSNQNDKFADKSIVTLKTTDNILSPLSPSTDYLAEGLGVFVDASGIIDTNNKTISLAFSVKNYFGTNFGSDEGFRPITGAIFIVDNYKRIELTAMRYQETSSIYGKHLYFTELAILPVLSREDFKTIVNAKRLDIRIIGTQASMDYDYETIMEFEPYFISNLKKFYETFETLEKEVMAN